MRCGRTSRRGFRESTPDNPLIPLGISPEGSCDFVAPCSWPFGVPTGSPSGTASAEGVQVLQQRVEGIDSTGEEVRYPIAACW